MELLYSSVMFVLKDEEFSIKGISKKRREETKNKQVVGVYGRSALLRAGVILTGRSPGSATSTEQDPLNKSDRFDVTDHNEQKEVGQIVSPFVFFTC